jgi:hypothetical protein
MPKYRAPNIKQYIPESLQGITDFIFGSTPVEEAQTALGPSPLALFGPSSSAAQRAFNALRKRTPEIKKNIWRHFDWEPDIDLSGVSEKYYFNDPETGELLLFKPGGQLQGEVEPVLSGITHTAQKIGGVKKATSPAAKVKMIRDTPDDPTPTSMIGSLQRFVPSSEKLHEFEDKLRQRYFRKLYWGGKPMPDPNRRIKSPVSSQEDVARSIAPEYIAGTSDRHPGNYVVDPERRVIPIDLGLGFQHYSKDPAGFEPHSVYHQFLDKKSAPVLRRAYQDSIDRILAAGTEPYLPFFDLFNPQGYYKTNYMRNFGENFENLKDPDFQEALFNTILGANPFSGPNIREAGYTTLKDKLGRIK